MIPCSVNPVIERSREIRPTIVISLPFLKNGIDTLTAITIITEIFEFGRFESPRYPNVFDAC